MNNRMKEEFETWAKSKYMPLRLASTGEYWVETTQSAWEAWQASRAAVVIELPQQSGANLAWNQAIRYCIQGIEAQGVKWK